MTDFIKTLASYVPTLIIRRLAIDPSPITDPIIEQFPASVLYADISGFTALTEQLAQQGPAGAEILTRELNAYFSQLIEIITHYGGDVVKFAGDALTAIWPVMDGTEENLTQVTRQAAHCGLEIQATLQDYQTADGLALVISIGLGAGEVTAVHIGGVYNRWEFVITGPPLSQSSQAEAQARPGEVVLSPEAWAQIETQPQSMGQNLTEGYVRLETATAEHLTTSPTSITLSPDLESMLRAYIPAAILARLTAGQSGWLAELRRVTVLFINLPDLTHTTPIHQTHIVMQALQEALYRYEGSVNKISVDDKGATLVAGLGLPPLAHEDDAARGVRAALAIQEALQSLKWRCAIGVTTGRAFCGSVGNPTRREYTMMGDVVNLAARLMQAVKTDFEHQKDILPILCDEPTYQAAKTQLNFATLLPIKVKGKAQPVPIFRPLARIFSQPETLNPVAGAPIVGREAERATIANALQLLQQGHSQVIIIEGEAGIGKSCLVEDLLQQSLPLPITRLVGAGDAIEKSAPYHAWRPVFRQLFELDPPPDRVDVGSTWGRLSETQQAQVLEILKNINPELVQLAPLLNPVLALDLPDNDFTRDITGDMRIQSTQKLLVDLLKVTAQKKQVLLILEDTHWLDPSSWALVQQVSQDVEPFLLVLASRPLIEPVPVIYDGLRQNAKTTHLSLTVLPLRDILALVCQRLGVGELPQPVATLILKKSEGHPFFSEELAYALRDGGLIQISDGQCRLNTTLETLNALTFPDTLQSVITNRIDHLTPQQQLTLKVASVIGRIFAFRTLHDVYPLDSDRRHLADYLETLEQRDLTLPETPEPDLAYIFKHIITQEVAYNLMAFSQRQQLHRAIAGWLEQTYADDLTPFYPLLIHHWEQGQEPERAVAYLLLAGDQARLAYSHQEAIDYYQRALNFLTKTDDFERTARVQMRLGLTYYNAYNFQQARQAYQEGFALWQQAGQAQPTTELPIAPHALRVSVSDVQTLDPTLAFQSNAHNVVKNLFSGLMEETLEQEIVPDVAQRWEVSENGQKYIFHLRHDVVWSNGVSVTAQDFEYAWKRMLDPTIDSVLGNALYDIKGARAFHQGQVPTSDQVGVRALDEHTLLVELESPSATFLNLVANTYPVPRSVVETHGHNWIMPDNIVTNGPFKVKNYQAGERLVLTRNNTFHGRFRGNLAEVDVTIFRKYVDSTSITLHLYESDNLDVAALRSIPYMIQQQYAAEFVSFSYFATAYINFNLKRPPLNNWRVRRAFALAINKEKLTDKVWRSLSTPANGGFIPPKMPGHSTSIGLPYDPDQAQQLLAEAGYPQGHGFPKLKGIVHHFHKPDADYVEAQWREILGVESEWRVLDISAFFNELEQGQTSLHITSWIGSGDPYGYLGEFFKYFNFGWHNETYKQMVEQAKCLTDPVERIRLYQQADEILVEEAPLIPLHHYQRNFLVKPWVRKYPTSPFSWAFWKDVILEPH